MGKAAARGRARPGRALEARLSGAKRTANEAIYAIVRRIPRGRVATYGQVAAIAGFPRHARRVGYALHALPANSSVPWHRVINARGTLSLGRAQPGGELLQRFRLEAEGVSFDARGRVALQRFGWRPDLGAEGSA